MERKRSSRRRRYKRPFLTKCKEFFRQFVAFLFSNIGIIGLVVSIFLKNIHLHFYTNKTFRPVVNKLFTPGTKTHHNNITPKFSFRDQRRRLHIVFNFDWYLRSMFWKKFAAWLFVCKIWKVPINIRANWELDSSNFKFGASRGLFW